MNNSTNIATTIIYIVIFIIFILLLVHIFTLQLTISPTQNDESDALKYSMTKMIDDNTVSKSKSKFFCNSKTKKVTFYDDPQYKGNSKDLCIGYFTSNNLMKIGSVKIPDGMTLEVFNKPDLKGASIKFTEDIIDANYLDNVYSIRINTKDGELSNYIFNTDIIES